MKPSRSWLPALALVALGFAPAGCGDDSGKQVEAKSAQQTDGRTVVSKVGPSTVAVKANDGDFHSHGSGVIIDADRGLVLTSNHLVEDAESLTVTIGEKRTVKARAVARAQCEDLALLGIFPKQTGLVELPLGDSDAVQPGDDATTLGYPGLKAESGSERIVTLQGRVSATGVSVELTPLLPEFTGLIAHQAPVTGSDSGGPLVDASGKFVGLNTVIPGEETGGLAYAIPTNRLAQLYGELREGETSFYEGWEKYHACHAQMARLARSVQVPNHDLPAGTSPHRDGASGDEAHSHGH